MMATTTVQSIADLTFVDPALKVYLETVRKIRRAEPSTRIAELNQAWADYQEDLQEERK